MFFRLWQLWVVLTFSSHWDLFPKTDHPHFLLLDLRPRWISQECHASKKLITEIQKANAKLLFQCLCDTPDLHLIHMEGWSTLGHANVIHWRPINPKTLFEQAFNWFFIATSLPGPTNVADFADRACIRRRVFIATCNAKKLENWRKVFVRKLQMTLCFSCENFCYTSVLRYHGK